MRFYRSDFVVITLFSLGSPSETDQVPRSHELGGLGLWVHRVARADEVNNCRLGMSTFVGGPQRVMA